jgi:hypothetical protein
MGSEWETMIEDYLCNWMGQGLRDSIDRLLALGKTKEQILSKAIAVRGKRSVTILAMEAYIDRVTRSEA